MSSNIFFKEMPINEEDNNSSGENDGFGLDNSSGGSSNAFNSPIKECKIESPEGKEILKKPGKIIKVDKNIIVYDSNLSWEQKKYIVIPDTNPFFVLVDTIYSNFIKKIKDIKDYAMNKIVKQKRALDIKRIDENYSRKRQRISTNLDDEFTKATGYSD